MAASPDATTSKRRVGTVQDRQTAKTTTAWSSMCWMKNLSGEGVAAGALDGTGIGETEIDGGRLRGMSEREIGIEEMTGGGVAAGIGMIGTGIGGGGDVQPRNTPLDHCCDHA